MRSIAGPFLFKGQDSLNPFKLGKWESYSHFGFSAQNQVEKAGKSFSDFNKNFDLKNLSVDNQILDLFWLMGQDFLKRVEWRFHLHVTPMEKIGQARRQIFFNSTGVFP